MAAVPYLLLYMVPTLAGALMAAYAWQRRYYRSGQPFALLMGGLAFWCGCQVLAIIDPSFEGTVFWALMQVGGVALVMPSWLLIAVSYSGQRWRRHRLRIAAIFVPAAISFIAALSNSLHGQWWPRVEPDLSRGYMWLSVSWGPAFWAHAVYAYTCFAVSLVLLIRIALRAPVAERRLAWLILGASLLPVGANLAFLAGLRPHLNEDPTPILLLISGAVAFYATLHFRGVDLSLLVEQVAVEALPDGMIVLDNQHVVAEINGVAADLLAVPPTRKSVGQPLAALLVGSSLGAALRPVLSGLSRPHNHHVAYDGQDGRLMTVEVRSRPLLAVNGAVAGTLLLLRDISERIRHEQAQAQHLAELSLLTRVARAANTAPDAAGLVRAVASTIAAAGLWERVGVGLLSRDGTRLQVLADLSVDGTPARLDGLMVTGPASAELVAILHGGQSCSVDLGDPPAAASPLRQALANEGLSQLMIVPLYHQGEPLGLLTLGGGPASVGSPALLRVAETVGELITDAVVRARLYDEARQAEQLKTSFLTSVSHELRTPLTSIIGYTEMIQRGIYGPLPEPLHEPLGFMRQSSVTLLRLINDLLDVSRAEAGHLQLELTPVPVLRAVANVVGQLQPQISERGLSFELDVPPELPAVLGNQVRIEQVVRNLLSNAIKFTERGTVCVHARRAGDQLLLSVSDTGVGIAPEHQELIFQEFRRVETPGRRVGGTGLGLAISRRLVELMGGRLSLESTPGVGSTFTLTLQVANEHEPASIRHEPAQGHAA
jgi:signal transduction histidine kinase